MREILCAIALFAWALPSLAVQSTFCLKLKHEIPTRNAEIACTVTQILDMSDGRAFWSCRACGSQELTLSTRSHSVGYSYEKRLAFSEHVFSKLSAEGKLLLPHFSLPSIVDKHTLRIYYKSTAPYATDNSLLLTDDKGGFHKIDVVSISYGSCQ